MSKLFEVKDGNILMHEVLKQTDKVIFIKTDNHIAKFFPLSVIGFSVFRTESEAKVYLQRQRKMESYAVMSVLYDFIAKQRHSESLSREEKSDMIRAYQRLKDIFQR